MKEMKILPGRHICGRRFSMRIIDVRNDEGVAAWIVYGICERCQTVIVIDMFIQPEEPFSGIDYMIDKNMKSGEGSEWKR